MYGADNIGYGRLMASILSILALSLNASAIYLGQGIGAAIGALVLDYTSLAALGGAGALCTLRPELNRPS